MTTALVEFLIALIQSTIAKAKRAEEEEKARAAERVKAAKASFFSAVTRKGRP